MKKSIATKSTAGAAELSAASVLKKYNAMNLFAEIDHFKDVDPPDSRDVCEELNNSSGVCLLYPKCSMNHHPLAVWAKDESMAWTCWKKNIQYILWILRHFHELPEALQDLFLPARQQLLDTAYKTNSVDQFIETYLSLYDGVGEFYLSFRSPPGSVPCPHVLEGKLCKHGADYKLCQRHPIAILNLQAQKLRSKKLTEDAILDCWDKLCSQSELYTRWILTFSSEEHLSRTEFGDFLSIMKAIRKRQSKVVETTYLDVLRSLLTIQVEDLKNDKVREDINSLREEFVQMFRGQRTEYYSVLLSAFKLLAMEKTEKNVKVASILKRNCYKLPPSKPQAANNKKGANNKQPQVVSKSSVPDEIDKSEANAVLRLVLFLLACLPPEKLDKLIEVYIRVNHMCQPTLVTLSTILGKSLQDTLALAVDFANCLMKLVALELKFKDDVKEFDELADKFVKCKSQLKSLKEKLQTMSQKESEPSSEAAGRNLICFLHSCLDKDPCCLLPPVELAGIIGDKAEDGSCDIAAVQKVGEATALHAPMQESSDNITTSQGTTDVAELTLLGESSGESDPPMKEAAVFGYSKYASLMQNKLNKKGLGAITDAHWFFCSMCKKGRIPLKTVDKHFSTALFEGHVINGAICPHCHLGNKPLDLRVCEICFQNDPESDLCFGCESCLEVIHDDVESFDPPHPKDLWIHFPQDYSFPIAIEEPLPKATEETTTTTSARDGTDGASKADALLIGRAWAHFSESSEHDILEGEVETKDSIEYAYCYYMRSIHLDVVIPLLTNACLVIWREVNSTVCSVCKFRHDIDSLLVRCLRSPVLKYIGVKQDSYEKKGNKFLKDKDSLFKSFDLFPEDDKELSANYLERKLDVPALLDLMEAISLDKASHLIPQVDRTVLRESRNGCSHPSTMAETQFNRFRDKIREIAQRLLKKLHSATGKCALIDIISEDSMLKTFDKACVNLVAQPLKSHYRLQVARESERLSLSAISELLRNKVFGQLGNNSLRTAKSICDTTYQRRLLYIPSLEADVDSAFLSQLNHLITYCKWDTIVNFNEINHKVSLALHASFGAEYWTKKRITYSSSRSLSDKVASGKHSYFTVIAAFGPMKVDESSLRATDTVLYQMGFGQDPLEHLDQLCLLANQANHQFASRILSYLQPMSSPKGSKHAPLELSTVIVDMELVFAYLLPFHKELYGGIVLLPARSGSGSTEFCTVSKDLLADFEDCLEVMHYGCHDYPTESSIASVRKALGFNKEVSASDILGKYSDAVLREEIPHFLKGNPASWYLFAHDKVVSRENLSTTFFNRDGGLAKGEHRTFSQVLSDMTGKDLIIIRHGLGTGGRTLARHIAYTMHTHALCIVIKNLDASLRKKEEIRNMIKVLQKRSGLKVVIIGEKPPHESLAGSFAQLAHDSLATSFILTTRILDSEISDLSAKDSNTGNNKAKRLVRSVLEILVPSGLSTNEREEFHKRLCTRSISLDGYSLSAEFFTAYKSVDVDKLLEDENYRRVIATCTDAKLLECGFAAFEVLAIRRILSSPEGPGRVINNNSHLLPDTFWGMLLLFPEYKDTIQKIMRVIFKDEFSEVERQLVIAMTFYGIFSPNHAVPLRLASYILSVYAIGTGKLPLRSPLTSFVVLDLEQGVIQFRNYHMVYCWADILFDEHIRERYNGSSYGLQHIKLIDTLMEADPEFCRDPRIISALQSTLCDYPVWHYLPALARLHPISKKDGSMNYEDRQGLRYSFFVEYLLGNGYEGFNLVSELYDYVIKNVLKEARCLEDDETHRFPSSVRTHYARLLTRTAEVNKNRSLLEKANEVLSGVSKENHNEQYFERKGSIERAKIRILHRELLSIRSLDAKSSERKKTDLGKDTELLSLDTAALAAARYYRQAMQVSRYGNPIPMLALVSNWLDTLTVLRVFTADDDYNKCFRQLQMADIESPHKFSASMRTDLSELLAKIRGEWIFDEISSLAIMVRNTSVYRLDNNMRVSTNRTKKDLNRYKDLASRYQSDEISKLERNDFIGPPYEWRIANTISEDWPLSEAKVKYSLLSANKVCMQEADEGARMNERTSLYVALELMFKLAVASQGFAHDLVFLPAAGNPDCIWHDKNKLRLLTCVNQWYSAAQGIVKAAGESGEKDYHYYGLTPVFGMYAHLIFVILNTSDQMEKLAAIRQLSAQLREQKKLKQWQFNTESRYYVTPKPKIQGLSFSQLIKSDVLFNQHENSCSFESFLCSLRGDARKESMLKVFSGVRGPNYFVCTELSDGEDSVHVQMQHADESRFVEGDMVTFFLGMAGSQLRAHAVLSASSGKRSDSYEGEDAEYY